MAINNTNNVAKLGESYRNVGTPNEKYLSLKETYRKNRAVLSGLEAMLDYDDIISNQNLLIPFSGDMTQGQYDFYKAEAEASGFTNQYALTLIGGLLRKVPILEFDERVEFDIEEATDWLRNYFAQDNTSLISFLDSALWEEMNTSRAWVCVNYPVTNPDDFSPEDLQPYPILLSGESIINWSTSINPRSNKSELTRLIIRRWEAVPSQDSPFHDDYVDTVYVHQLDDQGFYEIYRYIRNPQSTAGTPVIGGRVEQDYRGNIANDYVLAEEPETNIMRNGERLNYIPIFPLNGNIDPVEPILSSLINRDISLYNVLSRRNHLLYGAATYTPVFYTDETEDKQNEIVNAGLGSYIFLRPDDRADILQVPTDALSDLDTAIVRTTEDLARMGIRILSPENQVQQSGVALEIRNSAQTARLANLNHQISEQMTRIIKTMIDWRYDTETPQEYITFRLSSDFNPTPLGQDWLRLVYELYQSGVIPRSILLEVLKTNDLLPADYNDEQGQEEMSLDPNIIPPAERFGMVQNIIEDDTEDDEPEDQDPNNDG